MAPTPTPVVKVALILFLFLAGVTALFLMYHNGIPSQQCHPTPIPAALWAKNVTHKPLLLLWFWPENKTFDLKDCKRLFNIDGCHLTDDRTTFPKAQGVLVFHRAIKDDMSNLPTLPRPKSQRWIWFNMDPPNNTHKIEGIQGLFNLTLSYRKDADIHVRWKMNVKKNLSDEDFKLPKKERLLCWFVDGSDLTAESGERYSYYKSLLKHVKVDVFDLNSDDLKGDKYFLTMSSCKFYLSFERSIYKDYITEIFSEPLASGTVPIALGPPRKNYEQFVPSTSFIHVNDFPDAESLANSLLQLDKDDEAYMRYFTWRRFYTVRRHFTDEKHKFALAICQACYHMGIYKEYRVVPDLYKWFFL